MSSGVRRNSVAISVSLVLVVVVVVGDGIAVARRIACRKQRVITDQIRYRDALVTFVCPSVGTSWYLAAKNDDRRGEWGLQGQLHPNLFFAEPKKSPKYLTNTIITAIILRYA